MSDPNLPEGVTQKDIDAIGQGAELSYEELQEDLDAYVDKCTKLKGLNRELVSVVEQFQQHLNNPCPYGKDPTWDNLGRFLARVKREVRSE